jgi:hypothetical protein
MSCLLSARLIFLCYFIIGARIGYRQGTSPQIKGPSGSPAELPEIKRRTALVHADPLTRGAGLIEGAA